MYERSSYDLPLTIFSRVAIKSTVVVSHPSDVPPSHHADTVDQCSGVVSECGLPSIRHGHRDSSHANKYELAGLGLDGV